MIRRSVDAGIFPPLTLHEYRQLAYLAEHALIAASPQPQPVQAGDATDSVNETNAVLASRYFDLLKVVESYEAHGVTCQTFRHFVDQPCAECNSRQAPQAAQQAAPIARPLSDEQIAEIMELVDELAHAAASLKPYFQERSAIESRLSAHGSKGD
ncbi:MAG: hypothetical protein A2X72_16750 [Burkholderiales bacterium GWF1_66_17]|nr:MAG: hypothetical protein A2X73_07590 [Burkholderiales bacterium GWE1_65_30]OGA89377.1 MAG: hypothetical protein A2X72_16750 [Burkholderiales bacterium GWF1_66_17]HBU17043.1 hypothetical protein [Hydrogenophaga sp.]